jgi:hypothetical protein
MNFMFMEANKLTMPAEVDHIVMPRLLCHATFKLILFLLQWDYKAGDDNHKADNARTLHHAWCSAKVTLTQQCHSRSHWAEAHIAHNASRLGWDGRYAL